MKFYLIFKDFGSGEFSPRSSILLFDKTVKTMLRNVWELRVPALNIPLLTLTDSEIVRNLLILIHPMMLYDISLIRSDTKNSNRACGFPSILLNSCAMKIEKIALFAILSAELKDQKILGCRLNRGLDAIVAISFGNLQVESSGRNMIDLDLTYDPELVHEEGILVMTQAIIEIEGFWQYSFKHVHSKDSPIQITRPAVLEYWKDEKLQLSYTIKYIGDFFHL
jgi:hypothetical protein